MVKNNVINAPLPIAETKGGTNQTTYTTGDILYASSSNTLSKLAVSAVTGTPLISTGTIPAWGSQSQNIAMFEDLINARSNPYGGIFALSSQTVTPEINTSNSAQDSGHPGVYGEGLASGTGTGFWGSYSGADGAIGAPIIFGGGEVTLIYMLKISNLSDGTDTYTLRIGFGDTVTGDQANGCYFEYTNGTNSGKYVIKTAKASARSSGNTNDAASTNWDELKIVVNAAGTSVSFFVNGVECTNSPLATNVPTAAVGLMVQTTRAAGSTQRYMNIDFIKLYINLTAARP